jgi:peptide/nickel transport system substrate-binding protein
LDAIFDANQKKNKRKSVKEKIWAIFGTPSLQSQYFANGFYSQSLTGGIVNHHKVLALLIAVLFCVTVIPLVPSSLVRQASATSASSNELVIGTTAQIPAPTDLNPIKNIITYYLAETYASLIGWDSVGNYIPLLAQNWTVSPNGLTYTFNLRPNLKWSDGQPLNSSDVAFTANLLATQAPLWSYLFAPLEQPSNSTITGEALINGSVVTPNATQVVFNLAYPSSPFLIYAGGQPIYPEHYYAGYNLTANNPNYTTMVGSGPFIPRSFTPGVELDMVPNPYYFGGAPHLNEVIFKFFTDTTSAEIALEGGSINYLQDVPPPDIAAVAKTPGINIGTEEDQSNIYLIYNVNPQLNDSSTNPFSNLDVRLAVAYALNLPSILNSSFGGSQYYKLANQIEVPNMYYNGQPIQNTTIPSPEYTQNVTEAKALLSAAGYPNGFTANILFPSTGVGAAGSGVTLKMMQLMQAELSAVGITLTLDAVDQTDFNNLVYNAAPPKSWNLALGIISESPDGDVAPFYMVSGLGGNAGAGGFDAGGYNVSTLNGLVQLEENTTGTAQRIAVFQEIDGYVHQQLPVLEMYYELQIVAWSNQFTGFELGLGNPWHDYFGSLKMQSLDNVSMIGATSNSTTGSPPPVTSSSSTTSSVSSSSTPASVTSSSSSSPSSSSSVVSTTSAASSSSASSSSSSSNTLLIAGAIVVVVVIIAAAAAMMMRRPKGGTAAAPST